MVRFGTAENSSVAEGESATYIDIIVEFIIPVIFTTKFTTK